MATFLPPPANAPIAFWRDGARLVQCYPTRELSKFLETNFGSGETSGTTNITEETSGDTSGALVAELSKRVESLETADCPNLSSAVAELLKRVDEAEVYRDSQSEAKLAEMAKRIDALETELAFAMAMNAQLAQLAARINDLEIEAM